MRQFGAWRTGVGIVRLLRLTVQRPNTVTVITRREGLSISFRYPSQLMPTLVVFSDIIEPEYAILRRVLHPGAVAVDIGASIGTWTLGAALTGATVHACEPDPDNMEVLTTNLDANELADLVTTHRLAIGAHEGTGTLIAAPRRYLNRVADTGSTATTDCPITTATRLADNLELDEIDVLKVNTAGGERDVLAGALPLLEAGRVKLALFLDGLAVRPLLDKVRSDTYDVGVYDSDQGIFISVPATGDFDAARPSPVNRYILLRRRDVPVSLRIPAAHQSREGA